MQCQMYESMCVQMEKSARLKLAIGRSTQRAGAGGLRRGANEGSIWDRWRKVAVMREPISADAPIRHDDAEGLKRVARRLTAK